MKNNLRRSCLDTQTHGLALGQERSNTEWSLGLGVVRGGGRSAGEPNCTIDLLSCTIDLGASSGRKSDLIESSRPSIDSGLSDASRPSDADPCRPDVLLSQY